MKTKDRIIQTARELYNANRYGNVTNAILAKELGIAKGNLWYHFNEQRDLLAAISEQYIGYYEARRDFMPDPEAVLESFAAYLRVIAREIRDFRFLFRDQMDFGRHSEKLRLTMPQIYQHTIDRFGDFFHALIVAGYLDVKPFSVEPLATNAVMISRYALDMARERGMAEEVGSGAVDQSLLKVLSLFEDRLTKNAATYLRSSLAQPVDKSAVG